MVYKELTCSEVSIRTVHEKPTDRATSKSRRMPVKKPVWRKASGIPMIPAPTIELIKLKVACEMDDPCSSIPLLVIKVCLSDTSNVVLMEDIYKNQDR